MSIEKAHILGDKPLPTHLRYSYLRDSSTLPIIIYSSFSASEKEKLLRVIRDHKSVIGWSVADIKQISPSMCMHRILLEEDSKPTIEAQRRLHSTMKEMVRKEVLKWLDARVIYPISDR